MIGMKRHEMKPKKMTSIRLSDRVRILIDALCDLEDVTMTGLIEMLVKAEAVRRSMDYEVLKKIYGEDEEDGGVE